MPSVYLSTVPGKVAIISIYHFTVNVVALSFCVVCNS